MRHESGLYGSSLPSPKHMMQWLKTKPCASELDWSGTHGHGRAASGTVGDSRTARRLDEASRVLCLDGWLGKFSETPWQTTAHQSLGAGSVSRWRLPHSSWHAGHGCVTGTDWH